MSKMKHSGRVIIMEDDHVLLIRRVKKGGTYYVFPGGKGEDGETPRMTAMREAYEELGVQVALGECFAKVLFGEVTQYYFHAAITGGELGTGDAEEFTTGEGTYELVWMKRNELGNHPVIPVEVVEIL
ncbi:MAG: NUDIX domain-containing protein [Lysinibacillus sp.]